MTENDAHLGETAIRLIGALLGVLASLIMVAPDGTRHAFFRVLVGITMGFIFAPTVHQLPMMGFLSGNGTEFILASGTAAGFAVWFILEAVARLLSSTDWIVKTLRALVEMGGRGKE